MPLLRNIASGIRSLFQRRRAERELDEELRGFMEMAAEESMKQGRSQKDAVRAVRLERGNLGAAKELVRSAGWESLLETFWQDLRYGLRMLRKSPGFAAVAILTLALGIGANTAIFSVINSVLLQPLPFKNPAQLVSLRETESAPGWFPLDGADYLDWEAQSKTFSSMSLYTYPLALSFSANGKTDAEAIAAVRTEANFFETIGAQPLIGRTFAKGEDAAGKDHVAILSYAFWQRSLGGDKGAIGRVVQLNSEPFTIIGVMPAWFNFPAATDVWFPEDMSQPLLHDRGSHWANAIGRIRDGASIEQARADLLIVSTRLNRQYRTPDDQDIHALVFPLKDYLVGSSRGQLLILFGAVGLVLLVACSNVANLLLARSTGRVHEMALRAALGARRWRLARQLLTEGVLLALGGAGLGVLGALWGISILNAAQRSPIPTIRPAQVNTTVLLFTFAASVLVGILFGLAPALHSSRLDLSEELKSSASAVASATSGGRILRNSLMVTEIAVSLALLVGAGLLLRSFAQLRSANIGVNPHNVLTLRMNLPHTKYTSPDARKAFYDRLLAKISQTPGVISASASNEIALQGGYAGYVQIPGVTNPKLANQLVEYNFVTPDYFNTFGISLLEGRGFTPEDMQRAAQVNARIGTLYSAAKKPGAENLPSDLMYRAVINEAMAKTFWPNEDPIGKNYRANGIENIVIGVVGNERQETITKSGFARKLPVPDTFNSMPENYFALPVILDNPVGATTISLKTSVEPRSLLTAIRGDVRGIDSTLALFHIRTMQEIVADNMQDTAMQTFLLGAFALLALVIAAVGLYGVMSYLVTRRTHEIGIRMALGAQHVDILRMVISQGGRLIALGVAIGLVASFGLAHLLAASLYGVKATDPATYSAGALLLAGVALAACYIPARRAMRVDPMVALRYE